jgi:hypothetical protein
MRVLRVAGSPPLLLLTAVVFGIWLIGQRVILGEAASPEFSATTTDNAQSLADYFRVLVPTSVFNPDQSGWRLVAMLFWSIFVWTPLAMLLARQGALLTAVRSLMALGPGVSLATRRAPSGWLAALVPFLCVLPFVAILLVIGWCSTWFADIRSLRLIAANIGALIALPAGLLAFGSYVAIPISWAALINEQEADPLDALSRGYEYLFRRPVQLVFYALFSVVLLTIVGSLASAVAWSASEIATSTLWFAGASDALQRITSSILWRFPAVVVLTLMWSLVGGVYLLLRCDAGGQEVEDLWQPQAAERPSLPELPK